MSHNAVDGADPPAHPGMEGRLPGQHFTNGLNVAPRFPTVTAAIMHHIRTISDDVAVIDHAGSGHLQFSYAELGRRSRHLAHSLRRAGLCRGDRVPLVVKRGIDMVVGIVAILRCGAQYVPLDGGVAPKETLQRVMEQSGGKVVVCLQSTVHRLGELTLGGSQVVVIDQETTSSQDEDDRDDTEAEESTTADSGCYVIYTSGTTGAPKGVDVTHGNVANLVCSHPGNLGIHQGVRVGQVLNVSFDMAAWEILGCLCNGGTLVLRGSDWVETLNQINVLICTPSILSQYEPQQFHNLRTVATAGEPVSQKTADLWASYLTYYNCCGPTETTIVNTMQRHIPGELLSIGRPTPNNRVYILDEDLNQVAIGQAGTMWAGGKGVSRGYVGLPELTRQRYLHDKFANDRTKMYNTGDIGLWNPDGTIKIQGRCDDQVKIKGFRVELDGVTSSISTAAGVTKAATLMIGGELHAFLQPCSCDVSAVREHIEPILPYYACPAHYHVLESFPLTRNGKVDKPALRKLAEDGSDSDSTAGSTVGSFDHPTDYPTKPASTTTTVSVIHEKPCGDDDSRSSATLGVYGSDSSVSGQKDEFDLNDPIPEKGLPQPFRGLLYRIFIPYRFLFSVVWMANAAAVVAVYLKGGNREWLGNMVAVNLVVAVLIRQDFVINALYTIFCSVPKSWPLWIRAPCAKIYHLGGVHSSAASCAGLWLLAANINDIVCLTMETCPDYPPHSPAFVVFSWVLTAMFFTMLGFAWPSFRKANHNFFERWHRFMGWTMLAFFWTQTLIGISDAARESSTPFGAAVVSSVPFWLLIVATTSVALSWFWLRRVPVTSEVLSDHAVRLHFDYTVPVNGSFARLSFRPLVEWHSFATIPSPSAHGPTHSPSQFPRGYSVVVSNAGDWTRRCITHPPRHVWVRGVPTCGVMRIATLFNRVVVVATGSGIGPCLGHLQSPSCATQLVWSTRDPERSFGPDMVRALRRSIPDAVIWDTNKLGRPDMLGLSYNLVRQFGAEAVIVIANEKITKKIVYGLETRGISAYGAIWDS